MGEQYKPKIVKAKLKTGGRSYEQIKQELKGQGFTCKEMKAMVREGEYFDGLVVYLSLWNWDKYERWHLWNWDDKDDERVMLGIYEAEQYHPDKRNRYKDDFESFRKDWKAQTYDPGMSYTFKLEEAEVLEVLQEEENNIDPEEVKRAIKKQEDAEYTKRLRRRSTTKKWRRYK